MNTKTQLTQYEFCVVRRCADDGREFFDLRTLSGHRETAQRKADLYDQKSRTRHLNDWAADNPQVRTARVKVKEVLD